MNVDHIKTLAQVRAFLDGTQKVEFSLHSKTERYEFVRRSLIRFAYHSLSKPDKGLLLCFNGQPGYIRVDTVHQGDLDGWYLNGLYQVLPFSIISLLEYTGAGHHSSH